MAKRSHIVLRKLPEQEIRENRLTITALYVFEVTRESESAMKHYLEVARECYEKGKNVHSVKLEITVDDCLLQ